MLKLLDERTMARRIDEVVVRPIIKLRLGYLLLSLAGKELIIEEAAKTFAQIVGNFLLEYDFSEDTEESFLVLASAVSFLRAISMVDDHPALTEYYAREYHAPLRVLGYEIFRGEAPNISREGQIARSILNL